jgi:hypothetical protein
MALINAGLFTPSHLSHSLAFYREGEVKRHTKNMSAPGSFRDLSVYRLVNYITGELFKGTMKAMAQYALPGRPGDFSGTKLLNGETSHVKGWMLLGR